MVHKYLTQKIFNIKMSTMTHHFDRVSLISVSGRDLLITHSLHMNVMRKKTTSRKLLDADEHNILDCVCMKLMT